MNGSAIRVRLDGVWSLQQLPGDERKPELPCHVPGDVHSALLAAGRIADPMWGENERDVQWIGTTEWRLSRSVTVLAEQLRDAWPVLDLAFVDTVATVMVNGAAVAEVSSAFQRHRIDLTDRLREGENEIAVVFHSAEKEAAARAARLPFPVPYSVSNNKIPDLNTLRKPQCHGGWDWGPALMVVGLYEAPELRFFRQARIEHVRFGQTHEPEGRVEVRADVECVGREPGTVTATLTIGGQSASAQIDIDRRGTGVATLAVDLDAPALWWPAGLGDQVLHEATVSINGDAVVRRLGLRAAAVIVADDGGMAVQVNGRDVFCRGANWIPADALPSRVNPERLRLLLGEARAANMNMIRVWGGGFYETEAFYDLCDELGLMVWQDMMFACSQYPSTPAFLAEVDKEVRYQVKRLSSHASIVIWCGDNEVLGSFNWYALSRDNRDRYLVNYDRLNHTIEKAVTESDPDRRFWPSSPCKGTLDYGDAWHDDSAGDMHYWSVWHENKPFEAYYTVKPRFCSEFGFQSFPTMTAIRSFADHADWNATSPVMEWHQRDPAGNARIIETMARLFRMPDSFDEFVFLSQLQQALAIDTAVRFWRSLKPHCMGTLYWQLNDVWPAVSWASLDYTAAWKTLHHHAKRFFAPLAIAPRIENGRLLVSAVNDGPDAVEIDVRVRLMDLDGRVLGEESRHASVPTDKAVPMVEGPAPEAARAFAVIDAARSGDAWDPAMQCLLLAGAPKRYGFADTTVRVAAAPNRPGAFTLTADRPAFYVRPEAPECAGAFDDASILVLPDAPRTVTFRSFDRAAVAPRLDQLRFGALGRTRFEVT